MCQGYFYIYHMRFNRIAIIISLIVFSTLLAVFCTSKNNPADRIKTSFSGSLKDLQNSVKLSFYTTVEKGDHEEIKKAFLKARSKYKSIEYYIEYFFPTTAVMLNGAPIDEIELGENLIENPTGFQVMEALVYETPTKGNKAKLLNEIKKMNLNLERISRFNEQYQITDAQIFDAIRLEIFRITSLGITGFDVPIALSSITEADAALQGIGNAVYLYHDQKTAGSITAARDYLEKNTDFNSFDRLTFTTNYLQRISDNLDRLRKQENIPTVSSGSGFNDSTVNMFQRNALLTNRFVGNSTLYLTKEKAMLGKLLFSDVILSDKANRSCQSCHQNDLAFTDGIAKPNAQTKGKTLERNTPTLTYASLQRGFFYDLKAGSLEDQALDVIHQSEEMGGSLDKASLRINRSKRYQQLIRKAFGDTTTKINPWKIQHALASYIRTLNSFSSRLDRYMRGEKNQLDNTEKAGYNLFMGKAKCGSCHFAPLFNGTQSPMFSKSEAEVLGVPAKADTSMAKIDGDLGRYALYQYRQYKHSFKTPTLRNISKTAPYMHNGVYKTLEEVLDFYSRGGGAGIGIKLENQTLSSEKLNLNKKEINSIIAFLKTLED